MEEITEGLRKSNIEGADGGSDEGQQPSSKHMLTPESKLTGESVPKRFAGISHPGKLSNQERKGLICQELQRVVTPNSNAHVKQHDLVDLLELTDSDKSMLTRCVKKCFPGSTKKTIMINHEPQVVYSNITLNRPLANQSVVKELFLEENTEMAQIQQQVAEAQERLGNEWNSIRQALNEQDIDQVNLAAVKYQSSLELYLKLNSAMIQVYSRKIDTLKQQNAEERISYSQKEQVNKEVKALEKLCMLGLQGDDISHVVHEEVFSKLLDNFEETCPLIFSVLHTLLISDSDKRQRIHKTPEYKMKCGVNALALLLSVRNQKFGNDVKLLFGLLSVTYGAGKQFINMLHSIGLAPHWDTIINFLDKRLVQLENSVLEQCDDSTPAILLMDNINIYRGRKRHDRIFTEIGPKMWNFTGRAAIVPDVSEIEHLLSCKETTTRSQIDIASLTVDDILLDSMPDHKTSWEEWCDNYYLQLLDTSLNCLPDPPKALEEMNETEVNAWLRSINLEDTDTRRTKYNINLSPASKFCKNMQATEKTNIINLPLSLEDNSTLLGTAAIFEEFRKEFDIPGNDLSNYIEFNKSKKEFDLKSARERALFIKSLQEHRTFMKDLEKQMTMPEKDIEDAELQIQDSQSDQSDDSNSDEMTRNERRHKLPDEDFKDFLKNLVDKTQDVMQSADESLLDGLVQDISKLKKKLESTTDKFGRTVLHAAVEQRNFALTNVLISSGINPNSKELCGATPLCIAVLNSDLSVCKLLLANFAEYKDEMFASFPSPLDMAVAMESDSIVDLFNTYSRHLDCPIVRLMQSSKEDVQPQPSSVGSEMHDSSSRDADEVNPFVYKRSECNEFPTAVVGDVGTCKNNRSVRNKDSSTYGWSTEVPGDMHAKGYLCEAAFKAQGVGGFHKIVNTVMKRPKLTKEAFKKRKFQEQNLNRIKESVRDGSFAYGMAAVQEFSKSSDFPTSSDLLQNLQKFGDHNQILLERFKKWLKESAECNDKHKYHQQLFTLFGPLLQLFVAANKNGDGHLREVAWIILLPVFAQLGFRNYWTEAFVHVVNFTALWPLAFRQMICKNSTVNLSGKAGHNIDLDEYVETYIVRPLKTYVTGHTSVQMCKRIMGNLDVLGSTRASYASRKAFDHHTTTKHKEQSSFPDQIKGMWFCIQYGFFKVSGSTVPYEYPLEGPVIQKKVSQSLMQVKEKGEIKVKQKFEEKLHDCFPSFRQLSFQRVATSPSNNETV